MCGASGHGAQSAAQAAFPHSQALGARSGFHHRGKRPCRRDGLLLPQRPHADEHRRVWRNRPLDQPLGHSHPLCRSMRARAALAHVSGRAHALGRRRVGASRAGACVRALSHPARFLRRSPAHAPAVWRHGAAFRRLSGVRAALSLSRRRGCGQSRARHKERLYHAWLHAGPVHDLGARPQGHPL